MTPRDLLGTRYSDALRQPHHNDLAEKAIGDRQGGAQCHNSA